METKGTIKEINLKVNTDEESIMLSVKCDSEEKSFEYMEKIHDQLKGIPGYINNTIVLNDATTCETRLYIFNDCTDKISINLTKKMYFEVNPLDEETITLSFICDSKEALQIEKDLRNRLYNNLDYKQLNILVEGPTTGIDDKVILRIFNNCTENIELSFIPILTKSKEDLVYDLKMVASSIDGIADGISYNYGDDECAEKLDKLSNKLRKLADFANNVL